MKLKRHIASLNEKLILAAFAVAFAAIGAAYGYSAALLGQAEETVRGAFAASPAATRVLGTGVGEYYANPFEAADARAISFPVVQLANCRNWQECSAFCDEAANYQACVAWSHSLE